MPPNWLKDASGLNEFCWWCFENKINLAEADSLARYAVSIAEPGKSKAMIADTAAEICNARGLKNEAIKYGKIAIAEDLENKSYQKQLEKYQNTQSGK